MVKLNKIYTKTGDKGSTQLGNGKRVEKNSLRVDAYGYVDEANAAIGLSILTTNIKIKKILQIIQNDLFDLGADLCIPDKKNIQKLKITNDHVDYIEEKIDSFNKELAPLNSFVLPGGLKSSTYLHIARTVTRRAERILKNSFVEAEKRNSKVSSQNDVLLSICKEKDGLSKDVLDSAPLGLYWSIVLCFSR